MERKKKIKVIRTIRKTNYLKKSGKFILNRLKNKDEGVLKLIANTRLYPQKNLDSENINPFTNNIQHRDFFNSFTDNLISLNEFEFNVARKFIFNSIKNHENSYIVISALLNSHNNRVDHLVEFTHMNLIDKKTKSISMMRYNLIDYVLRSKPSDIVSNSLYSFLVSKKSQIYLNNQFVFFQ
jgi:hypothetical protein